MSNPNKNRGSQWERDVASYFRTHGFPQADRRYGAGIQFDKGDLVGIPDFAIECKNTRTIDLAQFVAEAVAEAINARVKYGAAIIKRRQRPVKDAYVVMTLEQFTQLLQERA